MFAVWKMVFPIATPGTLECAEINIILLTKDLTFKGDRISINIGVFLL